jgi:hypothetical protein
MAEEKRKEGKDKNLPTHDTHASDQKPEKSELKAPDADPKDLEKKHLPESSKKKIKILESVIKNNPKAIVKSIKESLSVTAYEKIQRVLKNKSKKILEKKK